MAKATKTVLATLLIMIMSVSCASIIGTSNLGSKVKKLEMGMTKQEAVSILGKSYKVVGVTQTGDGTIEIIRYEDFFSNKSYSFSFLEGKLIEWFEELVPRVRPS